MHFHTFTHISQLPLLPLLVSPLIGLAAVTSSPLLGWRCVAPTIPTRVDVDVDVDFNVAVGGVASAIGFLEF